MTTKVRRRPFSEARNHSYRRFLLDGLLSSERGLFRGIVVDLGGKRENTRGDFRPMLSGDGRWYSVNIDETTRPAALTDAHRLPFRDDSVDVILCCETLEHLRDPHQCCAEVLAALKPGGRFVFSLPLMYPVHADPYDFWRFTSEGVRQLCDGFEIERIEPMGSWLGTVGMFTDLGGRTIQRRLLRLAVRGIAHVLCWLDYKGVGVSNGPKFTTGYFCVARKPAR